jgi:hypothetical protein
MDIRSLSPLPTASLVFRPREGRHAIAVLCKVTYRLEPSRSTLAAEQEPIQVEEHHWDGDPRRSLDRPTDLVPFKPRVDVVVVGSAFAPQRRPVFSLVARIAVGELDKSIEVFGPRTRGPGGIVDESRFTEVKLGYERAAGGPLTWNPVGMRQEDDPATGIRALPQIAPVGAFAKNPAFVPPTGLGPIAASWPMRRDKLGARAAGFSDKDIGKTTLGTDFDATYFQAAPPDQTIENLLPDAEIVLENLHPAHPRLVTRLPGLVPRAFIDVGTSAASPLALRADTLWIDTDRGLCTVTFRGQAAIARPDQDGVVYVALEEPGKPITWADIRPMIRETPREAGAISDSWLGVMPLAPTAGIGQAPRAPSFDFDLTSDAQPEDHVPDETDDDAPTRKMSVRNLIGD